MELLTAAQAVYLRGESGLGAGTKKLYEIIRRGVRPMTQDRSPHDDIELVFDMVKEGKFSKVVRQFVKGSG
jgi:histidine ammonia-lyase